MLPMDAAACAERYTTKEILEMSQILSARLGVMIAALENQNHSARAEVLRSIASPLKEFEAKRSPWIFEKRNWNTGWCVNIIAVVAQMDQLSYQLGVSDVHRVIQNQSWQNRLFRLFETRQNNPWLEAMGTDLLTPAIATLIASRFLDEGRIQLDLQIGLPRQSSRNLQLGRIAGTLKFGEKQTTFFAEFATGLHGRLDERAIEALIRERSWVKPLAQSLDQAVRALLPKAVASLRHDECSSILEAIPQPKTGNDNP